MSKAHSDNGNQKLQKARAVKAMLPMIQVKKELVTPETMQIIQIPSVRTAAPHVTGTFHLQNPYGRR